METLKEILEKIMNVYDENLSNDEKHGLLSILWTKYYKLSEKLGIKLDDAYNLYLLGENESYIIYQEPERKVIDKDLLEETINHYNNTNEGLTDEEIKVLLNYVVENARSQFESMGINLKTSSLNGLCELGQVLTIMPLEKLGLKVTKNSANLCFNYPFNHVFGTVSFPYQYNDKIVDKTYLIDSTYRQFFTTVRCNEGRYYTEEENTGLKIAPDPGYFVLDLSFAKNLMRDGYIELTKENAKKYGEAFYKASIPLEEITKLKNEDNRDYQRLILSFNSDYKIKKSEIENIYMSLFASDSKKM